MIFLNSASSAAALVFYLSGVCTHTNTEGIQRKTRVRNILIIESRKLALQQNWQSSEKSQNVKEKTQIS